MFWQYQQRNQLETVYLEARSKAYQGTVIILVDELNASSSEEFAGGLQTIGRATIVGNRTPGSCLTAEVVTLANGAILIYPFGMCLPLSMYFGRGNGEINGRFAELEIFIS